MTVPLTRVLATFAPRNLETLRPGVADFVGWRGEWTAQWQIKEEDDIGYVGQWAWTPSDRSAPFAWAPTEDLEDVREVVAA